MRLTFGRNDVERWAQFSGDRNPIHFDRRAATAAGLQGPVAHGMLCLLPIKQALEIRRRAHDAENGFVFKAYFRAPAPLGAAIDVALAGVRRERDRFSATQAAGGAELIRGWLGCTEPAPAPDRAMRPLIDVTVRRRLFARSFPEILAPWIWLDALSFAEFIQRDLARISATILGQAGLPWDNGSSLSVMQTSQELRVWPAALTEVAAAPGWEEELDYTVASGPPLVGDGEVAGYARTALWRRGQPLLQADYGLLARGGVQQSPVLEDARHAHI